MKPITLIALGALVIGTTACFGHHMRAEARAGAAKQSRTDRIAAFSQALASSKTNLVSAIAAAEKATGGHAFSCEFELEHDGKLELSVATLKDGNKILEAEIDPATGNVMKIEDETGDDDHEDEGDDDDDDDDDDEDEDDD